MLLQAEMLSDQTPATSPSRVLLGLLVAVVVVGIVVWLGAELLDLTLGDPPGAQRDGELEAAVGVLEAVDALAQLTEPVAHGLRMHAERLRDGVDAALVIEPRLERLGEPRARGTRRLVERGEHAVGELGAQPVVGGQEQLGEMLVGPHERSPAPRPARAARAPATATPACQPTSGPSAPRRSPSASRTCARRPGAWTSGTNGDRLPVDPRGDDVRADAAGEPLRRLGGHERGDAAGSVQPAASAAARTSSSSIGSRTSARMSARRRRCVSPACTDCSAA